MERLKNSWKTFFRGDRLKNFCEDLFFCFLESTCACVLGLEPCVLDFTFVSFMYTKLTKPLKVQLVHSLILSHIDLC